VTEDDCGDLPPDEQALTEALRFWAEMSDGAFPADINMLMDSQPKLIKKFHKDGPAEQEYAAALKAANVVLHGLFFAQTLKSLDNWHYAGDGVMLGQADKMLCWWKNEDGHTWRVIYGDLSARDVPTELAPGDKQPP
jgi:hypothetical protein